MTVSAEQAGMMRNALGLLYADTPYRNHYCVDPSTPSGLLWEDLVVKGCAVRGADAGPSGRIFYHVTLAGHDAIGVTPER